MFILTIANKGRDTRQGDRWPPMDRLGFGVAGRPPGIAQRPSSKMPSCWVCPGSCRGARLGRTAWSSARPVQHPDSRAVAGFVLWPPITPGGISSPARKAAVMGPGAQHPVPAGGHHPRSSEANTRCISRLGMHDNRQAVAPSFSIRTASRAASAALLTCMGGWPAAASEGGNRAAITSRRLGGGGIPEVDTRGRERAEMP